MEGIRTSTGNETVDRLSRMNITGNIIPAAWYRTIRKPTGKPYLNAIVILSDIVYWYRAAEVRDEGSGQLLGYRKRFKADLLQRSYQQMADQFGITKRDATNAVVELERLGVMTCMECGSCAYVCPAGRQLVQSMRLGKSILRGAMAAKK